MQTRFSRVLFDHFHGGNVGSPRAQGSDYFESHRGGCNAVFPGYIHLPFCARDDLKPWTGECDHSSPWIVTNDTPHASFRNRFNCFQLRKFSPACAEFGHPHDTFLSRPVETSCKSNVLTFAPVFIDRPLGVGISP